MALELENPFLHPAQMFDDKTEAQMLRNNPFLLLVETQKRNPELLKDIAIVEESVHLIVKAHKLQLLKIVNFEELTVMLRRDMRAPRLSNMSKLNQQIMRIHLKATLIRQKYFKYPDGKSGKSIINVKII